jgi:hypothetical protein
MLVIFLKYYILLFICSIISLITGKLILSFFKIDEKRILYNLFIELIAGISFWVILYSIFRTEFKTVNILFIYILLSLIVIYKKQLSSYIFFNLNTFKRTHKDILILLVTLIPFYLYESFFLIKRGQFHFHIPYNDYFSYSSWSQLLNINGYENKFLNLTVLFPESFKGMMPYHYFELWLNALISKITNEPSVISLLIITYPLTYAIFTLGLFALLEKFKKLNLYTVVLTFFFILIGGVLFEIYNRIEFLQWGSLNYTSILSIFGKKFGIVYIFMLLSALIFFDKRYKLSLIILSVLPVLAMGTAFGIIGGVFLFIILNVIHRNFNIRDIIILCIHFFGLAIAYFSLYKIFGTSYTDKYAIYLPDLTQILRNPFHIVLYKRILSNFILPLIRFIIYYLPYIIVFFISYNSLKRTKEFSEFTKFSLLVFSILFMGNLFSALAFPLLDFSQLFQNILPLFNILIIIFIIIFLVNSEKIERNRKWIVIALIVSTSTYNLYSYYRNHLSIGIKIGKYSDKYIVDVLRTLSDSKVNTIGFYFLSEEEFKNTDYLGLYRKEPSVFIKFQKEYCQMVNLNCPKVRYNNMVEKYYAETFSEFNVFIRKQKEENRFISYEQSQLDFINKFNMKYCFTKGDSARLPPLIKKQVVKEIVDSRSKEHFYLLK